MLHNGAEYHGNYDCSFDELVGFHSRRIAVLAQTNADFLAFESVPSLEEARAILAALARPILMWRRISASPAGMSPTFPMERPCKHAQNCWMRSLRSSPSVSIARRPS